MTARTGRRRSGEQAAGVIPRRSRSVLPAGAGRRPARYRTPSASVCSCGGFRWRRAFASTGECAWRF